MIEGVVLARSMAPVGSGPRDPDVGRFKDGIHAKFEKEPHAFVGSIEAALRTLGTHVKAVLLNLDVSIKAAKSESPRAMSLEIQGALILCLLCAEPRALFGRYTKGV